MQIIFLRDFEYWRIYAGLTAKEIKEREESYDYPPRLQIRCYQIDASKALLFSFTISKRTMNSQTNIAQFVVKKTASKGIFV